MAGTFVNKLYIRNVLIDYRQQPTEIGYLWSPLVVSYCKRSWLGQVPMLMKASTFEVCSLVDQPYADNLMLLRSCSQRGLDESAVETIGGQHFLMID
jgi:hypothetical protein